MKRFAAYLLVIAGLVLAIACNKKESCSEVELSTLYDEETIALLEEMLTALPINAKVCSAGPFQILAPTPLIAERLIIIKEGQPLFVISRDVQEVWRNGSLEAVLTPKYLSYSFLEGETGQTAQVSDEGIDGQADLRLFPKVPGGKASRIRIEGMWYDLVEMNGKTGVVVDGVLRQWESAGQGMVFVDEE